MDKEEKPKKRAGRPPNATKRMQQALRQVVDEAPGVIKSVEIKKNSQKPEPNDYDGSGTSATVLNSMHNRALPIGEEVLSDYGMQDQYHKLPTVTIGGQVMPIVDIHRFGARPPNAINPEQRMAWFVVDERVNTQIGNVIQRRQYAYSVDKIMNSLEEICRPVGTMVFTDWEQGTWHIINSFGAEECGTFFQNPIYIMGTAERLCRAVNIKYEMLQAEEALSQKLGKHPGWTESADERDRRMLASRLTYNVA